MLKLTEQSLIGQLITMGTLITIAVGLFGSVVLLAADKTIDEKYATDADLLTVQKQVQQQVEELSTAVNKNSRIVQSTSDSVKALALSIVTVQIRDLEPTIQEMRREKAMAPQDWSGSEEALLRDLERSLSDLETQRRQLFSTITGD